jgi:hypothetical protein
MTSPDRHSIGLVSNPVNPLRYDGHNSADPFECTGILRSFLPAKARVLDVGCGTGSLTNITTPLLATAGLDRGPPAARGGKWSNPRT